MANEKTKELPMWKRIKQGDKLPCQSFLRKYDGEILRLTTTGGVTVGQDCFYLPVENVIEEIRKYPIEESKDEGIINNIKKVIGWYRGMFTEKSLMPEQYQEIDAWLEKQGGQKHQYNSRPRYVGEGELLGKKAAKIEPKFKVGDTMRTLEEANSGITDGMPVVVSIDRDNYNCTNEIIAIKDKDKYEYPPRNRKQESSDWSEEDENLLKLSLENLTELKDRFGEEYGKVGDCIVWQKSIKDRLQSQQQQQWKPSKEHLDALINMKFAVEHFGPSASLAALDDLYNQLNKLTE